jgi:hypothetical protein
VPTTTKATVTCASGYTAQQSADGVWHCTSNAELQKFVTTKAIAAAVLAAKQKADADAARLARVKAIAQAVANVQAQQAAAANQEGEMQAGMSRNTKLLWAAGALVAGVAVVWALKRKKAPKMTENRRRRLRRNAGRRAQPETSALTSAQRAALLAYAAENGRSWKSKLNADWQFARARVYSRAEEDYRAELQQVRNQFGPGWLHKVTLKEIEAA